MFCSLPFKDDIVRAVPTSALGPRRARPISSDLEFGRPGIVSMEANELKRGLLQTRNGRCWAATSAAGEFFLAVFGLTLGFFTSQNDDLRR